MRLDHLLSKEKRNCILVVMFSFERSCGALAQLGERLLCTQEVSGSIPLGSIQLERVVEICTLKIEYLYQIVTRK